VTIPQRLFILRAKSLFDPARSDRFLSIGREPVAAYAADEM
jgi:hypothetical protein